MKNAEQQTFPMPDSENNDGDLVRGQKGLTKREYFAVTLLQGILSRPLKQDSGLGGGCRYDGNGFVDEALKNADDLLKQLGFSTLTHPADHYGLSLILGGAEANLWDLTCAYADMGKFLFQSNRTDQKETVSVQDYTILFPSMLSNNLQSM